MTEDEPGSDEGAGGTAVRRADGEAPTIGIFGAGVMGEALLSGLLRSGIGRSDIFIVKLDRDGAWLFGNRFGTDNSEIGLDVAVGPDGQIAVAGRIFGTRGVDFGAAGRVESQGSSDGFVLQVEP